jgi:hypothetical protein
MTPTTMMAKGVEYQVVRGNKVLILSGQASQWMTPVVPNGGRTLTRDEVDAKGTLNGVKKTVPLDQQARYWPTPTAQADQGPDSSSARQGGPTLVSATTAWPTPSARDGDPKRGSTKPGTPAWENKVKRGTVGRSGMLSDDLKSSAAAWPTPRASMGPGDSGSAQRQQQGPNPGLHDAAAAWPTPMAADWRGSAGVGKTSDLPNVAQAWPTPASMDYRTPNLKSYEERGGEGKGEQLANFVAHLWPTPNASLIDAKARPPIIGNRKPTDPQISLADIAVHRFSLQGPTTPAGPTSSPEHPGSPPLSILRLNPNFVEWLMGWPMGWTSPIVRGASSAQETASWHCALQQHLSALLGAPPSSIEASMAGSTA